MAEEFTPTPPAVPAREMHKRREVMADGRRYIIYYTFGDEGEYAPAAKNEVSEDV